MRFRLICVYLITLTKNEKIALKETRREKNYEIILAKTLSA